jgi:hypothetical protein
VSSRAGGDAGERRARRARDGRRPGLVGKCAIVVRIGTISTLSRICLDGRRPGLVGKCAIVVRIGTISTLSRICLDGRRPGLRRERGANGTDRATARGCDIICRA